MEHAPAVLCLDLTRCFNVFFSIIAKLGLVTKRVVALVITKRVVALVITKRVVALVITKIVALVVGLLIRSSS